MTLLKYCPMCNSDVTKFAESHIIPKSLWNHNFESKSHVSLFYSTTGEEIHLNKVVVDKFICISCECKFSDCDNYALEFFVNEKGFMNNVAELTNGRLRLYNCINRFLLRKFFATLLLRADLTKSAYLQNINIGPKYRKLIVKDINKETSDAYNYIDAYITKRTSEYHAAGFLPAKARDANGVNGYKIGLPYYEIFIKLDSRTLSLVDSNMSRKSLANISRKHGESSYSLNEKFDQMNLVILEDDRISESVTSCVNAFRKSNKTH